MSRKQVKKTLKQTIEEEAKLYLEKKEQEAKPKRKPGRPNAAATRQYASAALTGLLANPNSSVYPVREVVREAFNWAEAMLEEEANR